MNDVNSDGNTSRMIKKPVTPVAATQTKLRHKKQPTATDRHSQKLAGAEFRWINERLYTIKSDAARTLFMEQPGMFEVVCPPSNALSTTSLQPPTDEFISLM